MMNGRALSAARTIEQCAAFTAPALVFLLLIAYLVPSRTQSRDSIRSDQTSTHLLDDISGNRCFPNG